MQSVRRTNQPEPVRDYPRVLGPFVLAAPENTAGEMPAWLAMASSGGQPYLCRLQALPMPLSTPPGTARRIQRATRGLRRLPRRNLAAGMGLALVDQRLMLVERPTAGVSLADLLPGAFPADSACLIVQQLARVLTGLRKRGLDVLVTGRLAPERVRIGWNGEVQLLGAGLAIARREGLLAPSLPELPAGPGRPSPAQDVRALGVLLWELLSGQSYGATTANVSADQSARRRSDLPRGLPPQLYAVIAQALAPQPDQRHASAKLLARALDEFAPGRWRRRRLLRRLLARRMDVARGRSEQAALMQAAAHVLAAHAPAGGAPSGFSLRRWPLVWATAAIASALAAVTLLAPLHPPAPVALVARKPVAPSITPLPPRSDPAPVATAPAERTQARVAPARVPRRRSEARPATDVALLEQGPASERQARTAQALAALDAAESRFQWRDLTGAERLAREALIGLPSEPRAHYFLGLVLLAMDRASDAAGAFRRTIELDPGFADVTTKLQIAEEKATTSATSSAPRTTGSNLTDDD